MTSAQYPIGTPGKKWDDVERQEWLDSAVFERSYQEEVVSKLEAFRASFDVEQYGELSYDKDRYRLFVVKTRNWDAVKPVVLITGGVHGYETSGIHGALRFVELQAQQYSDWFNIAVAPCVSPWGYETINRWNPKAIDPNRSFVQGSASQECSSLIQMVSLLGDVLVHFDLHETTDTDETEFRPALAARDGVESEPGEIPDGFYTVADAQNPQPDFQTAIIDSVAKVTHIAPADSNGEIIGAPMEQRGVINYDVKKLGLCTGLTNAKYTTTTEVYPDSPNVTATVCNEAQVSAIVGGLDYVLAAVSI